jgi:hypothetical protein
MQHWAALLATAAAAAAANPHGEGANNAKPPPAKVIKAPEQAEPDPQQQLPAGLLQQRQHTFILCSWPLPLSPMKEEQVALALAAPDTSNCPYLAMAETEAVNDYVTKFGC